MGFTEVAPGVLVNEGVSVSIPHPDPCWVIENKAKTMVLGTGLEMLVFSSEQAVSSFLNNGLTPKEVLVTSQYSWDEVVDLFSPFHSHCIVDHTGLTGFFQKAPLRKDI
jgi:hypothetical protein